MLKMGVILFWTDMKHLYNWEMDNFKFYFLSRRQLGIESIDNFLNAHIENATILWVILW